MRWALVLFLVCELATFTLLARQGVQELGRSAQGWDLTQWLLVAGLAGLCGSLAWHWPKLWRGAACAYGGLAPGRDSTGRPGILVDMPDGSRAIARVESSWELGELALVLALEPVAGQPPRVLVVNRAFAGASALRALRRTIRVARREGSAVSEAG
ncbi:hypothetical protein [Cupriavidus basilensis]|uniref:hypothetical protein n=1 Tax=Cupriavidus basilensis TaxID=68895 RepID=UPI001F50A822|nr:hypothetical protein [Cupriavidus basilensis]